MAMSADLQWLIIRNNSSYLLKGSRQTFSTEPNNLKAKNCFRYNGLVNRKTVGVEPSKDGKGVVMVTKNSRGHRKPAKSYTRVELKKGARRTMASIRTLIRNKRYRKDLKMAAVRRASAIIRSQRPVTVRKAGSQKKTGAKK
ncbi:60S ribosomal protein L28-like [Mytilus californianus]|uniref:60S ribosomal protein L28-like n=1 Tax=Mytilus californianus TaxID=6549 RepID=UPI002248323B|nr:60S ribosomal protein L28-like [Mytilus californianus]